MCICVNIHIYTNTHRGGINTEAYEADIVELVLWKVHITMKFVITAR